MKPRQADPTRAHQYGRMLDGMTATVVFTGGPRDTITGRVSAGAFLILYQIERNIITREWRMELTGDRAIELLSAVVADRRWARI
jgi:hypothetical protein